LRFTRDKRGYETTSLVHSVRRKGRSRQRILYWFRTPPDVKVGRPALDEEAIRWIEEHNPDIEFDWQKILEARPTPQPATEEGQGRRVRKSRPERPRQKAQEEPAAPEIAAERDVLAESVTEGPEEPETPEEELVEAIEQLTHPDAEEKIEPHMPVVEHSIGHEQLIRLRARFAELQARITERGGDAERVAALRIAAEPLNPDTWVTEEEARKGLEEFDPKIRDIRAVLGLRRRRRARRGGRGRGRTGRPQDNGAAGAGREQGTGKREEGRGKRGGGDGEG
jgi:hypothetical protein